VYPRLPSLMGPHSSGLHAKYRQYRTRRRPVDGL
jgi:hypothetical protein